MERRNSSGSFAVEGRHILKEYPLGDGAVRVLSDVSLQIARGEFVAIMGPSGSGKSTLLYILGGLDVPTGGNVLLNGVDISGYDDQKLSQMRRRDMGFVFQFYNLIPNLNVEENVMLPLLLDGKAIGDYRRQLNKILEMVGLTDRRRHTPRELSGGQQQRVAIARALIGSPGILFADEPTGNLDSKTGEGVMELLSQIHRESNQTILMVTHSLEAARYADQVITVQDGRIL